MAGKQIIHFNRDRFSTSGHCRQLTPNEKAGYFTALLLLSESEEKNPLRGCLCVGNEPMSLDEWSQEVGFRRLVDAKAVWSSLFDRTLFQWFEHNGRTYVKVSRFEKNQDRMKEFGRKKTRSAAKDPAEIPPRSSRDLVKISSRSSASNTDSKEVTSENSWKPPQDPLTTLTYPNPNGLVTAVGVESDGSNPGLEALKAEYADRVKRLQDSDAPDDVKRQLADRYRTDFERRRKALGTGANGHVGAIASTVLQEAEHRNAGNRNGTPMRAAKDTGKDTAEAADAPSRQEVRSTTQYVAELFGEHPRQWSRTVKRFSHSAEAWRAFGQAVAEIEGEIKRRPDAGASALVRPGAVLNAKLDEIAVKLRLWRDEQPSERVEWARA